jgi:hypothetical protein
MVEQEKILAEVIAEENLLILNGNVGVATDFVKEAMERDPLPVVHI